jgi:hypothetical protein
LRLAKHDPIKAQVVQLRVFAGLTNVEAAEILSLSTSTAERISKDPWGDRLPFDALRAAALPVPTSVAGSD